MKRKDKPLIPKTITLKQAVVMTVFVNACFVLTMYGKGAYNSAVIFLTEPVVTSRKSSGLIGPYSDSLESNFKNMYSSANYNSQITKKLTKKF